jgi:nicotinamidase-related amidase
MPISQLDEKIALVVIDIQKGIVGFPLLMPAGDLISRAASLADAFRAKGQAVVLVNVNGAAPGRTDSKASLDGVPADFADLVPELNQQPSDILVTKQTIGAFTGSGLHDKLRAAGVTQVFVVGIATSLGVEGTARTANELGYNVVVVTDAVTDVNEAAHSGTLGNIFPHIAETGTTDEVLALLNA